MSNGIDKENKELTTHPKSPSTWKGFLKKIKCKCMRKKDVDN